MHLQVLLQSSALQARRNVFLQVENKLLNLKDILRYTLLHFILKINILKSNKIINVVVVDAIFSCYCACLVILQLCFLLVIF